MKDDVEDGNGDEGESMIMLLTATFDSQATPSSSSSSSSHLVGLPYEIIHKVAHFAFVVWRGTRNDNHVVRLCRPKRHAAKKITIITAKKITIITII